MPKEPGVHREVQTTEQFGVLPFCHVSPKKGRWRNELMEQIYKHILYIISFFLYIMLWGYDMLLRLNLKLKVMIEL